MRASLRSGCAPPRAAAITASTLSFSRCNGAPYSTLALRRFARTLHRSTEEFVTLLYRLAAACPLPHVRAEIVANLLEEEGFAADANGVTYRPAPRHAELCRRFAHAVGVEDDQLAAPTGSISGRWFESAMQERRWLAVRKQVAAGRVV